MPEFEKLLDLGQPAALSDLAVTFPGFFHFSKILARLAAASASEQIKVPK